MRWLGGSPDNDDDQSAKGLRHPPLAFERDSEDKDEARHLLQDLGPCRTDEEASEQQQLGRKFVYRGH